MRPILSMCPRVCGTINVLNLTPDAIICKNTNSFFFFGKRAGEIVLFVFFKSRLEKPGRSKKGPPRKYAPGIAKKNIRVLPNNIKKKKKQNPRFKRT